MKDKEFINEYLDRYKESLFNSNQTENMIKMKEILLSVKENNNKVIIAGNGGSAAMASHVAVDFLKALSLRAMTFNESSLITCYSNDYG